MHVLMISDVYFPRINGVSTSIETFRRSLVPHGVTTTLVAPAYPGNMPIRADELRILARYLPFSPEDRLMRYQVLNGALAAIPPASYDLIHIQTPFAAHYAGIRLAKRTGKPVVTTYHTLFVEYIHCYVPRLPACFGRQLAQQLSCRQCNQADLVIAPSRMMHTTLRDYGVTVPIEVVPTGVPIEHFQQGNGLAFRQRFAIPLDRIVALYVGRIAHEKNLPLLLNAFAVAWRQVPSLMLIVAGEGPARPSVETLAHQLGITEAVRFLGYLNRDHELPDCYHAADLFLFPSHTETQGLVLIEALAAGLPVVGLPIMGAADIILAGRGSVPVGATVEEMANVLRQLACDANLRGIISQAGRQFAQSWSDTAMAKRLAYTYQHMLDGHTLRQSTGQIQTD